MSSVTKPAASSAPASDLIHHATRDLTQNATHSSPISQLNYDGRRFSPVGHPDEPQDTALPVGHYHQSGDLVWAEFSGPSVRLGRLLGTCQPDGTINAAYCMVTAAGETVAGDCVSTPAVLADGRVRLTEHWRRLDGSSGISHIEEVRQ